MPLVGQPVPYRNAGVHIELLDGVLGEAAELDAVEHPPEDAGGVADRLVPADMGSLWSEVGDVAALIVGAATSKAHRVRVAAFSKTSAMLRPRSAASQSGSAWLP